MLLSQIFPPESISLSLGSESKDELFEEIVDIYLRSRKSEAGRDGLLAAIQQREDLMSTGIKEGIALPHGKCAGVKGVEGVIGFSPGGIDYDSLDGKPVHLVFLLLSSPSDTESHLRALKRLASLLDNPAFLDEFARSTDSQAAFRILSRYEDSLDQRD